MSPSNPIATAIAEIRKPTIVPPKGLGRRGSAIGIGKVSRQPARRYGPKLLHRSADPTLSNDWCAPWPEFVAADTGSAATTSLSEQMLYAALALFFGDPPHFWEPPYVGGLNWSFQTPLQGGRLLRGGQVCDFLVQYGDRIVCLRLQSERYHVMAEHAKQVADLYNKVETPGVEIRDIYEQDFVADCTLRAAVSVVAQTLSTGERPSPIMFGIARQVRR